MARSINLTGKKYGKLIVLRKCEHRNNQNEILWLCECECGKKIESTAGRLNSGNTKSCGCSRKEKLLITNENKKIDMSGRKIGKLEVLESVGVNKYGNFLWRCLCECGKEVIIPQGRLKSNRSKVASCGCYTKEAVAKTGKKYGGRNFQNLSGQTFGWLRAEERLWDIKKVPTYRCICLLCGNEKIAKGALLKNGHVSSCGCIKSVAEKEMQEYLYENNISFVSQYWFADCRRINPLPFDFAIFNTNGDLLFLVELDGIQHYKQQRNRSKLSYIQENDKIKSEYCKSKNISLLRIPYCKFKEKINIVREKLILEDLLND